MSTHMAPPTVLPSSDARVELPRALRRFREEGWLAVPLIFGSHRKPEAAVIPFDLYRQLLPAIEELEIAALLRERTSAGEPVPLSDLTSELGLKLE